MNAQLIATAQAMYNRLLDLSNKLTRQYKLREIEFDENGQTLRLRLGQGTIVYLNLEREEYDIFLTTNHLSKKALKVVSQVNEVTAVAVLETMPDSFWHVASDTFTVLPTGDACSSIWLNFFLNKEPVC